MIQSSLLFLEEEMPLVLSVSCKTSVCTVSILPKPVILEYCAATDGKIGLIGYYHAEAQ